MIDSVLWLLLVTVGVHDAKDHRIPNYLLGLMVFISVLVTLPLTDSLTIIAYNIIAMALVFLLALMCHLAGWMAPGDVKLLAVIGFLTGFDHLSDALFWISVSAVYIGLMYWVFNYLIFYKKSVTVSVVMQGIVLSTDLFSHYSTSELKHGSSQQLVMPFAPVVVCGIALAQYFQ